MSEVFEAPLEFPDQVIPPEWIDFNGHMNVAWYLYAFDRCVDHMYNRLGVGPEFIDRTGCSVFTLEAHINYLREAVEGDSLRITGRLIDHDEKRIHAYFEMCRGEEPNPVAAMEQIGIHVDMSSRRPAPFSAATMELLDGMIAAHRVLPAPGYAGRVIAIRRKPD